ncbi:MAG: hypothetical protein E7358_04640 [Clostridiales bacterium]|nr:hypothetical protein [Clostridiales bacterium]
MNFNAENQNNEEIIEQSNSPINSIPKSKNLVLKERKISLEIKIMFFSAIIAIILLISGASLYHYSESVNIFGSNIFSPEYSKTFKDIKGNMYDDDYTLGILIGIAILVVALIITFVRRKKCPTMLDNVVVGMGFIPAIMCVIALIYMGILSGTETSGVGGVLSAVGRKSSTPTFAFFVIAICCLLFAYGVYKEIKKRKELAYESVQSDQDQI